MASDDAVGTPAAWQYRYRPAGHPTWSDWADGRAPVMRGGAYDIQERPLYTAADIIEACAKAVRDLSPRLADDEGEIWILRRAEAAILALKADRAEGGE